MGKSLIINLPGQPKAIREILQELMTAIPYTLELVSGNFFADQSEVVIGFRPKSAPPLD